jgi:hypothetical protein
MQLNQSLSLPFFLFSLAASALPASGETFTIPSVLCYAYTSDLSIIRDYCVGYIVEDKGEEDLIVTFLPPVEAPQTEAPRTFFIQPLPWDGLEEKDPLPFKITHIISLKTGKKIKASGFCDLSYESLFCEGRWKKQNLTISAFHYQD